MPRHAENAASSPCPRQTSLPRWVHQALRLLFCDWPKRRRQRLHLANLDDQALRDIGLTKADVVREIRKPCWR